MCTIITDSTCAWPTCSHYHAKQQFNHNYINKGEGASATVQLNYFSLKNDAAFSLRKEKMIPGMKILTSGCIGV